MYQKDFILRMIEMIGELIAGILGLILKEDFGKASQLIENAYPQYLKKEASFFREIDKESLLEELQSDPDFSDGHFEILSELFFAEAKLLNVTGNKVASIGYYEKSIQLLDYVIKNSKTKSFEKEARLKMLEGKLEQSIGSTR